MQTPPPGARSRCLPPGTVTHALVGAPEGAIVGNAAKPRCSRHRPDTCTPASPATGIGAGTPKACPKPISAMYTGHAVNPNIAIAPRAFPSVTAATAPTRRGYARNTPVGAPEGAIVGNATKPRCSRHRPDTCTPASPATGIGAGTPKACPKPISAMHTGHAVNPNIAIAPRAFPSVTAATAPQVKAGRGRAFHATRQSFAATGIE